MLVCFVECDTSGCRSQGNSWLPSYGYLHRSMLAPTTSCDSHHRQHLKLYPELPASHVTHLLELEVGEAGGQRPILVSRFRAETAQGVPHQVAAPRQCLLERVQYSLPRGSDRGWAPGPPPMVGGPYSAH